MDAEPLRIIVLGGLVPGRPGRSAAALAAAGAGRRAGREADVIDLAAACLPEPGPEPGWCEPEPAAVRDLRPWLAAADGFAVVVPARTEHPPPPLRSALTWCADAWRARPVALLPHGYGPDAAVPAGLRQAFAEAHALTVATTDCPDDALDQLTWWARALRTARTHDPYRF
ncbi:NAD(P)H-dependent oxidoreductase [Streptomyces sp. A7024]|uniref:NAD(P)H-dependent oxidoreductase n=1 Tax=Streptomyces coryli TaxID=1128680 RepID=A0A6G4TYN0_9ACTN|nr:NAD(P)H-dependent oxidoreductase [Streptomyces coryli]NGN64872.1 NAD(P)H-dependent oxidoreductase [Streptomyces coryli]